MKTSTPKLLYSWIITTVKVMTPRIVLLPNLWRSVESLVLCPSPRWRTYLPLGAEVSTLPFRRRSLFYFLFSLRFVNVLDVIYGRRPGTWRRGHDRVLSIKTSRRKGGLGDSFISYSDIKSPNFRYYKTVPKLNTSRKKKENVGSVLKVSSREFPSIYKCPSFTVIHGTIQVSLSI